MRPFVRLRHPDGTLDELEHGDLIGRVWTAALVLDDPRVSEAHALISLREGAFWMLALRRMLGLNGRTVSEVQLEPGLQIQVADGLTLEVDEVALPSTLRVIEADGLPRTVLPSVCTLRGKPRPQLVSRFDPDAPCAIWSTGEGWRARTSAGERALEPQDQLLVEGTTFTISEVSSQASGHNVTLLPGGMHAPLLLIAGYDTVQIHRANEPIVLITGVQGRILSELILIGGPVAWQVVAGEVWDGEADELALRKRWDVTVARLRRRLRTERVRPDLLRADGTGLVELVLHREDQVEDRA